MLAAAQHFQGTIQGFPNPAPGVPAGTPRLVLRPVQWPIVPAPGVPDSASHRATSSPACMSTAPKPRQFFIQGITRQGRTFRPSDWAERLAGALSSFRPKGTGIGAHIGYSPLCVPRVIEGVKCVIVSEELRAVEPMAWDFVMHFARDNDLQVVEACLLPDAPGGQAPAAPR